VALRRPFALVLVLAGLAAGLALGAAAGSNTSTAAVATICPGLDQPTMPCCGPPIAIADSMRVLPCPGCDVQPCPTIPQPTVPNPTPLPAPKLTIPRGGLTVRHGRFRVTCTLSGGSGPCAVTARRRGRKIGSGTARLSSGRARVTVKLLRAGSSALERTSRHHMQARLTAVAGGRRSTVTATLKTG
jgi:hypothetical protein